MPSRYYAFAGSVLITLVSAAGLYWSRAWLWPLLFFGFLALVGLNDLRQEKHTLRRNYPLLAWWRYFLESIGPEIRQYFIESDNDERPFSRQQRSIVYQRAKNALD